jgi:hypothetical protein
MIPPPAQRQMAERAGATTTEAPGSHAIYVSQPSAVASVITQGHGLLAPRRPWPEHIPAGRQDANVLPAGVPRYMGQVHLKTFRR